MVLWMIGRKKNEIFALNTNMTQNNYTSVKHWPPLSFYCFILWYLSLFFNLKWAPASPFARAPGMGFNLPWLFASASSFKWILPTPGLPNGEIVHRYSDAFSRFWWKLNFGLAITPWYLGVGGRASRPSLGAPAFAILAISAQFESAVVVSRTKWTPWR
jgi:hypothetical protein